MDRFLKIKRKKSPGRSQQPTPSGEPTKIAAGSSNLREEQGVVPRDGIITLGISSSPGPAATDNGSSRANSRTEHQDEALELCTSGLAVSGTGHGNGLMGGCSRPPALLGAFFMQVPDPRPVDGLEDGAVGVRESGPAESSWGVSTSRLSRLLFNIDQLQRGPARAPCLGKPPPTPVSQRRSQKVFTRSKFP